LVEGIRLLVLALVPSEIGQSSQRRGEQRMMETQSLLPDMYGSLQQWFGLLILALLIVQDA
jgi:hypothetical protein